MTNTQELIGKLVAEEAQRDAIHIAVLPVIANEYLTPGTRVGIMQGTVNRVSADATKIAEGRTIGIVDPFLRTAPIDGERVWLFLDPNTITSLRHNWTHPLIGEEVPAGADISKAYAEKVLRGFAATSDARYSDEPFDKLLSMLGDMSKKGYVYGNDASGEIPANVWDAYEAYTGERAGERPEYFSCSC
jgi:hypothetical protein